jgi:hypothetical protein
MITITNNIYVGSNGSGKTFEMMNYEKELQNSYIPFIFLTTIEETLNIQNDVYEVFNYSLLKILIN